MDAFLACLNVNDATLRLDLDSSIRGDHSRRTTKTSYLPVHHRRRCKFSIHPCPGCRSDGVINSAWIGSVQYALVFLPGLIFGRLFDIGYFRIPFLTASSVLVICTFLIAECTQYWHFMLCQGLAIGVRTIIYMRASEYVLIEACFYSCAPEQSLARL